MTLKIFLAGATGVIGSRLVPLMVAAGHEVTGMTRTPDKAEWLAEAGAVPFICDVYDSEAMAEAVFRFRPDLVMNQLTDLPDDVGRIEDFYPALNRIRREGTRNLLDAARAADAGRFSSQSVAWEMPGERGAAVAELEGMVLAYPGVVLRYGQLYGPGTYYPGEPPAVPLIHVDEAARRTLETLEDEPDIVTIVED